jgi:hypothetical protein
VLLCVSFAVAEPTQLLQQQTFSPMHPLSFSFDPSPLLQKFDKQRKGNLNVFERVCCSETIRSNFKQACVFDTITTI